MKLSPKVSVIMPVYNSERYLREAIESVLNQTFEDFEFLIFDDGSTDASKSIVTEYAEKDKRIIPFYSDSNCGYVVHLNKGIEHAKGEFIARMDSDDVSLPFRFEKQVKFLNENKDIQIVGSSAVIIDEKGLKLEIENKVVNGTNLNWCIFFKSPVNHPSVMIRKEILTQLGGYNVKKIPAEDYDLWVRVLKVGNITNIKEPLLYYRYHVESISVRNKKDQIKNSLESQGLLWKETVNKKIPDEILLFFRFFHTGYELKPVYASQAFSLLIQLFEYFELKCLLTNYIKEDTFKKLVYLTAISRGNKLLFFRLLIRMLLLFPKLTVLFFLKRYVS